MEEMEKTAAGRKIGEERLREWTRTLLEYQAGKHSVDILHDRRTFVSA